MKRRNGFCKRRAAAYTAYLLAFVMVICVFFAPKQTINAATSSISPAVLPSSPSASDVKSSNTFSVSPGGQQNDRDIIQRYLNQGSYTDELIKIVLKKGVYYISAPLLVYSNTWIYAESGVTLINTNTSHEPLLVNAGSSAAAAPVGGHNENCNIYVTGGIWDGNANIKTSYNPIMMIKNTTNVVVSGCTFQNSVDHMLNLSGSAKCLVENCTFKNQKRLDSSMNSSDFFNGYTTANDREMRYMSCEALHLDFTNAEGETGNVLDGTPPENITIKGCTFTDVFGGIGTHHNADTSNKNAKNYATGPAKAITIQNNTFKNVKGSCVSAYTYTNVLVSGNTATNCGQYVNFNGCTNCEVSGTNTVSGCYQATAPYDQHQINIEGSTGISISGVTASAGTSYPETYNLYISDSKNITVSGSSFSQAKNYAAIVLNSSDVTLDSKNTFNAGGKGSVDIESSTNVTVDGNTLAGAVFVKSSSAKLNKNNISGGTGIAITGGSTTNNVVISSNTIKNSSTQGVHVYSFKGKTEVSGNTISDITNHAVFGSVCSNLTIKNNTFANVKNHVVNMETVTNSQILSNDFSSLASGKKGVRIVDSKTISIGSNNLSADDIKVENSSGVSYLYADASYTGITKYSGSWYYVKKGSVDTSFTGFAKYNSDWYYVEKGNIPMSTTGIYKGTINGTTGWYYVKGNKYTKTSAIAKNPANNTWWRVTNGTIDFSFSGFFQNEKGWWYCKNGQITFTDTGVFKGTINGVTGWYYAKSSQYTKATVIAKNPSNNTWWRVKDGTLDFSFSGFFQNEKGWWYCKNGQITFTDTGVFKGTINGVTGWYYAKGSLYTKATVIAKNPSNNTWWRVKDGTLDFSFNGFYKNSEGWWYCKNGQITFADTGVFKGTIDGVTGYYYAKGSKYTPIDTVAKNSSGYWCVKKGMVDFNFTGIWSNESGSWYCKKGQVQFGYTGKVSYGGKTYNVVAGKVK